MSDNNEFKVLEFLNQNFYLDLSTKIPFSTLRSAVNVTNEELDKILNDFEKKRYIDQFTIGHDEFILIWKQEGVNAYLALV